MELLNFFLKKGIWFDVFNFYFGASLFGLTLIDVPILKKLGKKIFFYFHGCDIRDSKLVTNKYEINACANHWPIACSPNRKKAMQMASQYASGVFVSTPDLLEFIPGSIWLPQPIDMTVFRQLRENAWSNVIQRPKPRRKITIAHAPSNRQIKGTYFLEAAVSNLKKKGIPIELILLENKSYDEVLRICVNADIIVDQLMIGAYGQFAVEMMALGKPVICYIRDDLRSCYPTNLPIRNSSYKTIQQVIEELIDDRKSWFEIGQRGMQYVDQVHDSLVIAQKTIKTYQGT